jgi:hypothetical protein
VTHHVHFVLLEFGQQHERAAVDLLGPALQRIFPAAHVRGVVVDNALSSAAETTLGPGLQRVNGDNTFREFSGWDRGLAWLERRYTPGPDSIVVLANDTIVRAEKRDRLDVPAGRADAARRGALVGYVEAYPRPVTLFGETLRQWVDTSFVIAAHGTLAALRPLARPISNEDLFSDARGVFKEPSPLSDNYRAYLRTWLTGERLDSEFNQTWHAHQPLTEATVDVFKAKVRSFLCEHLMSARARRLGIPMVDIRPEPLAIDPT